MRGPGQVDNPMVVRLLPRGHRLAAGIVAHGTPRETGVVSAQLQAKPNCWSSNHFGFCVQEKFASGEQSEAQAAQPYR